MHGMPDSDWPLYKTWRMVASISPYFGPAAFWFDMLKELVNESLYLPYLA